MESASYGILADRRVRNGAPKSLIPAFSLDLLAIVGALYQHSPKPGHHGWGSTRTTSALITQILVRPDILT